jgi:DNA-binding beta-propeller fold protein YncE
MRGVSFEMKKMVFAVLAALVFSCAKPPVEKIPNLYWPLPPERPRIKFVNLVSGSRDISGMRSSRFTQLLFGAEGAVHFTKPSFVAARDNILYVSDFGLVHVYDFKQKRFSLIGRGWMGNVTGLAVTSDRTLYVADSSKRRVYILGYGAKKVRYLGKPGDFISPAGIAVDEEKGRVLVVDSKRHAVAVYSRDGEELFVIGKRGIGPGEFNFPYDVALGPGGMIVVMDSGNFRVQIFDGDGKFIQMFGDVGSDPGLFARPKGISVDSKGHIYVVDAAFGNFQIFSDKGDALLAVGTGGVEPGMFKLPLGIGIDENDRIYVVDQMNKRVQIFQYIHYPDE